MLLYVNPKARFTSRIRVPRKRKLGTLSIIPWHRPLRYHNNGPMTGSAPLHSIHSTNLSAASMAESNTSSLQGLMSQKAPPHPNCSKHEYRTCRFWGWQQFTMAQTQWDGPSSYCAFGAAVVVVVVVGARVGLGLCAGA